MNDPVCVKFSNCQTKDQETLGVLLETGDEEKNEQSIIEWKTKKWNNTKKLTKYVKISSVNPRELNLSKILQLKLLVHLRRLPKDISDIKAQKFVRSILNAIKYDECLLIEVDEKSAKLIGHELKHLRKTNVIGVLKADVLKEEILKTDDENEVGSPYSNFRKLILTGSSTDLHVDLTDSDVYMCEVELLGSDQANNGDDPDEFDCEIWHVWEGDVTNTGSDECSVRYNECSFSEHAPKVYVKQFSHSKHSKHLTFKEACKPANLKDHIYKEIEKHYKIDGCSAEAFRLRIALSMAREPDTSEGKKFNWKVTELEKILCLVLEDSKTKFLYELVKNYKSKFDVMQTVKKIVEEKYGDDDCDKFLKDLKSAKIQMNKNSRDKEGYLWKLFMVAFDKKKLKASLFYWSMLDRHIDAALLAHYVLKKRMASEHKTSILKKYETYANLYQDKAEETLKSCYLEDYGATLCLLISEIPKWGESYVTLAIKTENKTFLKQNACTALNSLAWTFYQGNSLTYTVLCKEYEKTLYSPKIRCRMDMIGYLLFLTAYSLLLVSYLSDKTFHFLEVVVMGYMLILFLKELDQVPMI